jgi:hypothetical protein
MIPEIVHQSEWLQVREQLNNAARSSFIVQQFSHLWRLRNYINIVDLVAGTGELLRYLAPQLPLDQSWELFHSPELESSFIQQTMSDWAHEQEYTIGQESGGGHIQIGDYRITYKLFEQTQPFHWPDLELDQVHALVSTDGWSLVPTENIIEIIHQASEAGIAWYSSMVYNSHIQWKPSHSQDALMLELLHRSIKESREPELDSDSAADTDEEIIELPHAGPEPMGDEAPVYLQRLLAEQRYLVHESEGFWNIKPADTKVIRLLFQAYRHALKQLGTAEEQKLGQQWLDSRSYELAAGKLSAEIGFSELLAKPLPKDYKRSSER